jgi:hypothetical protein
VRHSDDRIRIEVVDKSHNLPHWGAEANHDGKIVWVELASRLESDRDADAGHRSTPVIDLDALEAAGGWDDVADGPLALRAA